MRKETVSSTAIREGIEALRHMTVGQLKQKYGEVVGEASRSNHKQFLVRRVAWRMQANAWGGLSERARRRALEIADDSDLRIRAPKNFLKVELDESRTIETRVAPTEDPRLPIPGTMLVRRYRGKVIRLWMAVQIRVTATGRLWKRFTGLPPGSEFQMAASRVTGQPSASLASSFGLLKRSPLFSASFAEPNAVMLSPASIVYVFMVCLLLPRCLPR